MFHLADIKRPPVVYDAVNAPNRIRFTADVVSIPRVADLAAVRHIADVVPIPRVADLLLIRHIVVA